MVFVWDCPDWGGLSLQGHSSVLCPALGPGPGSGAVLRGPEEVLGPDAPSCPARPQCPAHPAGQGSSCFSSLVFPTRTGAGGSWAKCSPLSKASCSGEMFRPGQNLALLLAPCPLELSTGYVAAGWDVAARFLPLGAPCSLPSPVRQRRRSTSRGVAPPEAVEITQTEPRKDKSLGKMPTRLLAESWRSAAPVCKPLGCGAGARPRAVGRVSGAWGVPCPQLGQPSPRGVAASAVPGVRGISRSPERSYSGCKHWEGAFSSL